jgi:arginine N-succinyltransferase
MTQFLIRPAEYDDVNALLSLAEQTGGGLTNLPSDRDDLENRVARSLTAMDASSNSNSGGLYLLVCEDLARNQVVGTASLFAKIGVDWPFYSYRVTRLTQANQGLGKSRQFDVLHLVNDYDGYSEVGGLFLDPDYRGTSAGRLLARSRYLFIAQARGCFGTRVIADLRGYADSDGRRPFWEAVGRHFFDMPFEEADQYNALEGNQFIADLMPKHPLYAQLLPNDAQSAIGKLHDEGRGAYKMLMNEGFRYEGGVDVFDAGPTVVAEIDDLLAIKNSRSASAVEGEANLPALVCTGALRHFRATFCDVGTSDHIVSLQPDSFSALALHPQENVRYVLV